ncbi:MAG: ParB/RepB/Spo0J family partition protein [Oscillospiraceae bacterium]|nr:ParB/RepB/Spo0J family partition protein [Oscillospiraceae bacterium]
MKKKALGGAFDSIFDDDVSIFSSSDSNSNGGLQTLKIGEVEPNRDQPRKDFNPEKLEELANSIRQHGIVQPITVREIGDDIPVYQIVAGERRWRAARLAGLEEVPVRIMELTDSQTMQIALIENLQRENLNPFEEALGYKELIDNYNMTQEQLAEVVGKARSSVTNSLRLLKLPPKVIELVRQNALSKGHCKALMSFTNPKRITELAEQSASGELSVRELERLSKIERAKSYEDSNDKADTKSTKPVNTYHKETELALGQMLGVQVRITDSGKKKSLCIDFADDEQLKNIVNSFKY